MSTVTQVRKVVLAGNPNVGKSVFFNALTGLYVDVSNYPGTTIEIAKAPLRHAEGSADDLLMDTPGVYGISSFNDEERIARDIIMGADVLVNVVSARSLERDLFLTQQLIDMGIPLVVALNQADEAEAAGIRIDVPMLSELLGVPVIPTVATRGEGVAEVKALLSQARRGRRAPELEARLEELGLPPAEGLLLLEGDIEMASRHGRSPDASTQDLYAERRARVDSIVSKVVSQIDSGTSLATRTGRALLNPCAGLLAAMGVLAALYWVVGDLVAQQLVALTEEQLMQGLYEPWVRGLIGRVVSETSPLYTLLAGEFGVVTMTVTYVLGLLLPLAAGFYFFLAVLEDTGYLPRLAVLVDRGLSSIGLNGRAVIPLIIGFGCVTMATITTRLLGTARERTIATAILGLTIPCSAQVGIILGMLAKAGGAWAWAAYGLTMFTVLVAVGTILDRLLPGQSSSLLIDLPPMRLPQWRNVFKKTATKSWGFLKEATPLFFIGALAVGVLQISGGLQAIQTALAPVVVGVLQLPAEAATAFIMGLIRRDFGAAGLTDLALGPAQIVVSMVVITLFVPCIATVVVLFKERGWKEAASLWIGSWVLAFCIGGILTRLL